MPFPKMTKEEREAYDEALEKIETCQRNGKAVLDLSDLGLSQLPPEICKLTSLRSLKLFSNQLCTLPPDIGKLTSLTDLDINSNQLESLPIEFWQLTALENLNLGPNRLETIPPEIGQLINLVRLELDNNKLSHLPPEIGYLKSLTHLYLQGNQIASLPPEIWRLMALNHLILSENQLTSLPPEIDKLEALNSLSLDNNQLASLPPEIGKLGSLNFLNLDDNQLTSLPPEIGKLGTLNHLILSENQIVSLPPEIGKLGALNYLNLYNNQLASLPPEIGALGALNNLYLDNNQLASLPPEIGKLGALNYLSLNNNQLASLPVEIGDLNALKLLLLHGNPKLDLPESILGENHIQFDEVSIISPEPRAILDYYFEREKHGSDPMQEVRLLLVGRGRVGKTSLLKRLLNQDIDAEEGETPGISVEKLPLACIKGNATAHAWDFGGQEFLHGTHQIFLSERCVYLLVLQGRESNWETETDYWLRFIESFGGDSPVIVALNKYEDHPFSVDRHRLKERCPQIVGFVETDAITGLNIAVLRNLLEGTVNEMPDVWMGVARNWHAVKQELENMDTSFLSYADYRKLCVNLDVSTEVTQDSLSQALHRLGIALNFRDHHRLRNTSVLKPEWVAEAVYGLIRHTQKLDCHGLLHEECLSAALQPAENYPPDKYGFVVNLMEKFEVAFLLEDSADSGKVWLIPELLGEEQPDAFEQFRSKRVQRLRFTYPAAIPPGLLPRLIVRTNEMSRKHPDWRWKTGVVLEWFGCQALVRLDRLNRRTEVAVIGEKLEDQQSLFDIIRAHLIELHGNVKFMEETEMGGMSEKWISVGKLRFNERKKTRTLQEYINDEEVRVQVSEELDQVESDAATEASGPDPAKRMHLFISYAHVNEKELIPFKQHLTLLSRRGYIQVWNDRDLVAGEKWEKGIMEELNRADIVLLFYTTGARISDFIQNTELPVSIARAERGECTIIWVPLERNELEKGDIVEKHLSSLTCATLDKKCIYDFEPHQIGWMQVEESIKRAVERRRSLPQRK